MLLNLNSFFQLKYLSKIDKKKKEYFSAGKSVKTVKSIESATIIMQRLGESLQELKKI